LDCLSNTQNSDSNFAKYFYYECERITRDTKNAITVQHGSADTVVRPMNVKYRK